MKKIALFTALAIFLIACEKSSDNDHNLKRKWEFTEFLADPGDGSGTWQPVNVRSAGTITFMDDGTLLKTGFANLYFIDINRYVINNDSLLGLIKGVDTTLVSYEVSVNKLTINPPCIEACGLRLKAVK